MSHVWLWISLVGLSLGLMWVIWQDTGVFVARATSESLKSGNASGIGVTPHRDVSTQTEVEPPADEMWAGRRRVIVDADTVVESSTGERVRGDRVEALIGRVVQDETPFASRSRSQHRARQAWNGAIHRDWGSVTRSNRFH